MRGDDKQQLGAFSYVSLEERVPSDHPLRIVRKLVDEIFRTMSKQFDSLYSATGRPSIPPERLLRALLLQILYSVRSERMLMEQMDYNLLFRWFVGVEMDEPVWNHAVFSKNRDRLLNREVARVFVAQKRGSILAVGSTATVSAQPRETAYRASTAALKAHIEVAAVELAPFGIRVNLLTPGGTDTPFVADAPAAQRARAIREIPLRREARSEEMAPAALFLLSERLAGYITGTELIVDGGLRHRPIFGGSDDDLAALNT